MKLPRKIRLIVIVVGAVVIVLVGGSLPWPKHAALARVAAIHADVGCSLASLNGIYAVGRQGTIIASLGSPFPAPPFPFGEAGIATFNGAWTFFGKTTVNAGGLILTPTFTGTYTVNSDCTGTVTVNSNLGLTLHNAIVVTKGGQGYIETQTDAWAVAEGQVERL